MPTTDWRVFKSGGGRSCSTSREAIGGSFTAYTHFARPQIQPYTPQDSLTGAPFRTSRKTLAADKLEDLQLGLKAINAEDEKTLRAMLADGRVFVVQPGVAVAPAVPCNGCTSARVKTVDREFYIDPEGLEKNE